MADRDCFLYVDAPDRSALLSALSGHLGVTAVRRTLVVPGFEVDVVGADGDGPGFLGWRTKVELYASAPDSEVVPFVTDLMVFLRSRGHRVVAACDFEDELPQTDLD